MILGNTNCCPLGQNFDFMSVTALFPKYWMIGPLDPNNPPYFTTVESPGHPYPTPTWVLTYLPTDYQHPTAYSKITTVTTYNYGRVVTTVQQNFPYFVNPVDRYDATLNANVGNPRYDLRLIGWPGGPIPAGSDGSPSPGNFSDACDSYTSYLGNGTYIGAGGQVFSGGTGDTGDGLVSGGTPTGVYWTGAVNDGAQSISAPPVITNTGGGYTVVQHYPKVVIGSGTSADPFLNAGTDNISTAVSGLVNPTFSAACAALLNAVPLIPQSQVAAREGNLYFDYFGTTSVYPNQTNYAAGKTYDASGNCVVTVPANVILGIQLGANDAATNAAVFAQDFTNPHVSDTLIVGAGAAFWGDGSSNVITGFTVGSPIKTPNWNGGINVNNTGITGAFANCFVFCSKTTTVTIQGGGYGGAAGTGYTQWSPGMTPAVNDIIINTVNLAATPARAAHWLMKCTAVTSAAGGVEPNWAAGGSITDGGVTWLVIGSGAPVTALITKTHSNRFMVFPLKGGSVVAVAPTVPAGSIYTNGLPLYLAINSNPYNPITADSSPPNFPDCYVCQETRLRIPRNPTDPTLVDVTCYADICPSPFDLFTTQAMAMDFAGGYADNATYKVAFFKLLTTGETFIGPGDVGSPIGQGYIQFGTPGSVNYSPTHGGPPTNPAGGSSQDNGGL